MAAQTQQLGFTVSPPTKDGFGGAPWKADANLARLADQIMKAHPERFRVASQLSIAYLWRAKGGTSRGEPRFADCIMLGGLAFHFSEADFVIWFAADHIVKYGFKERDFEAMMFRQLMHIGSNENTGSKVLVPFDFKGFNAELVEYGAWDEALKKMSHTLQPTLFDGEEEEDPLKAGADYSSDDDAVVDIMARREERAEAAATPEELPPAETLPTTDLAAEAMAEAGWTLPPTSNGHPHTEADAAAEEAFAAGRRK